MCGYSEKNADKLIVTKVNFSAKTGEVTPKAIGAVDGWVKDQWAFEEFPDENVLAVATTDYGQNGLTNNLFILKDNGAHKLKVVASVMDFGEKEDIRAIRYVNNIAYVVTFKKTDPLFAIDLSDLYHPKMLDELEIPGFSTYLHPLKEGLMIGIGFDAKDMDNFAWFQGIKISLFDASDPRHLKELDKVILGDRGSYSEVTANHHAFYIDEENQIIGLPITELKRTKGSREDWSYGSEIEFSGAVLFHITDQINEIGRISHSDFIPKNCIAGMNSGSWWQDMKKSMDINRMFKVDERLLSLSRFGIKSHNLKKPEDVNSSLEFAEYHDVSCPEDGYTNP